jgi:APA family basic amino acid/polyamine antiporter
VENGLRQKYGLITAIAMVVGIVIGSGVFFKAEKVLVATQGNLPIGILAWAIGGLIMLICAYTFSVMATRYSYVNGIVDYSEAAAGKTYAYYVGWFLTMIYYPSMTSVLAWVSARYTCVLLGMDITGGGCMTMACLFLVSIYALNALSPILAGKFQVSTTIIKLVPLLLMAVVGTAVGLSSGMTVNNFTSAPLLDATAAGHALFTAVVATAFAYEGWIIATSINAELKDPKRNLPRALVIGCLIVAAVYILYYVGLAGAVPNQALMESGEAGARLAFETLFSRVGGVLLFVFVIISCLGTLNGLMLGCSRGLYALAVRDEGPNPTLFRQVDPVTNMPTNSAVVALLLCGLWLFYFYGANLTNWFGPVRFDSSELPIITIYAFYIPIFLMVIKKETDLSPFRRFVMPVLALCGCLFMIVAACFAHGKAVAWYLLVFAVVMVIGVFCKGRRPSL